MLANTNTAAKDPLEPQAAMDVEGTAGTGKSLVVESRFGTLEISQEAILTLPNGLLGFTEYREFGLAALPGGRHPQFRVLQCLTSPELAFLVAPLNMESNAIAEEDLSEACTVLDIPRRDLAVVLIVTVRRDGEHAEVSVNMRAPVFVDTANRTARQYVMPTNTYSIRHTL